MRVNKLCGPVILTHPLAPRHTGYVAELLMDVEDAGRLLVFGLGTSQVQHKVYLDQLGIPIQRCKLFSEKYVITFLTLASIYFDCMFKRLIKDSHHRHLRRRSSEPHWSWRYHLAVTPGYAT